MIRSKILADLDSKGIPYKSHIAGSEEYIQKLHEKLLEEAEEFVHNPMSKEELADLLEVVESLKKLNGWNTQEIEEICLKKREEKGGFDAPIILEES